MEVKLVELAIVVLFYALWFGIGLYYSKRALAAEKEYLAAGSRVGPIVNALAILAVYASAGSFMGATGLNYKLDIAVGWMLIVGSLVGYVLAMTLTASQLRKAGVYTLSEFFKYRYESRFLVILTAVIIVIGYIFYMVSQIKAIGIVGEFILGVPYEYGILLSVIVFAVYTVIGGMPATTINQAIQGALMIVLILAASITALNYIGWFPGISSNTLQIKPQFLLYPEPTFPLMTYVGACIIWACTVPCSPPIVMRFFTAFSPKQAKLSCAIMNVLYSTWMILGVGLAAVALVFFPPAINPLKDADFALFAVMERLWPPVGVGLIAAGVFGAAMSTISGQLLAVVGAMTRDIIGNLKPEIEEKTRIRLNVALGWIIAIVVLVLSLNPPPLIVVLYTVAQALITATVFAPTIFGIWWKRFNSYGALASAIVGAVTYIALYFSKILPLFGEFVVALPLSLIAGIVVTYATSPPSDEIIRRIEILHK